MIPAKALNALEDLILALPSEKLSMTELKTKGDVIKTMKAKKKKAPSKKKKGC